MLEFREKVLSVPHMIVSRIIRKKGLTRLREGA